MYISPLKEAFTQAVQNKDYDEAITYYRMAKDKSLLNIKIRGKLPLNEAIRDRHDEFIKFWLGQGADPNVQDSEHNAALHVVGLTGRTEYIPVLLKHDADLEGRSTMSHKTPFYMAFEQAANQKTKSAMQVMRSFVKYGADAKALVDGNAAVFSARKSGAGHVLQYLEGNYQYQKDYFTGKLYKLKMPIDDLLVSGIRSAKGRPLNFMIFAVREEFDQVIDYAKSKNITPIADDFAFKMNDKLNVIEVLNYTGQIDLVADRTFWQGNIYQMETFQRRYKDILAKEFLEKFDEQISLAISEKSQNIRKPHKLRRRR